MQKVAVIEARHTECPSVLSARQSRQVWQKICHREIAVELPGNDTLEKLGDYR